MAELRRNNLFSHIYNSPYECIKKFQLFDAAKNSRDFVQKLQLQRKIPVHSGCVNSICWNENGSYILSGSDDQRLAIVNGYDYSVLFFKVKISLFVQDVLINCQAPVTSLAVNPLIPYQLAVGSADASVRIFDRRMLSTQSAGVRVSNGFQALMTCFTVPEFEQSRRITSLCYSSDGQEMLVSYSSDYIYLFDVKDDFEKTPKILCKDGPSTSSDPDNDSGLSFRGRPLMKRLRIRGDWSDTGPNARPESEARELLPENTSRNSIVRTMTDILTRMFNNTSQNTERSEASHSASASSHGSSSEDIDAASDEDRALVEPSTQQEPAVFENQPMDIDSSEPVNHQNEPSDLQTEDLAQGSSIQNPSEDNHDSVPSITYSAFESDRLTENVTQTVETNNERKTCDKNPSDLKMDMDNTEENPNHEALTSLPGCSSDSADNYDDIKASLESRRKDLIERHGSEPMVNLHYSGQSVNSGLITMDVATSSTPNERQWLEQTASELPELPSYEESSHPQTSVVHHTPANLLSGSDSETEAAVQTIQPNSNLPTIQSDTSRPLTFTERADAAEDELELMVEVDSCSWDSDEDNARGRQGSPSRRNRRTRCDRHSDDFMCSLNEKVKAANDELKREEVTLQNVTQPRVKRKYTGHRNARTMIKESTFWGDNFIMSGSDCGHIFIWDRYTAELIMLMEADHHVVNCLQPHPFDPILASSGIDNDIKLWAPTREEPFFDVDKANEIIKRNEVMLEETKDTITVPASFMFRMFTSLSNFRTGRAYRWSRAAREMRAARERENQEAGRR
nr:DDB1- and CUL4-associated factor 6 [Parasteatoda tepidariorum]